MPTMFDWTIGGLASHLAGASRAHTLEKMGVMIAAIVISSGTVEAQVSPEFAEANLAPAAEEMAAAGVDGSLGTIATLIEIAQRHGFGYGISPDEVRQLVGDGYLAVRQIDCRSLDDKAEAATRLSRALASIAWLYAAGAGMSIGAPPVAAALGLGALISGMGATVASWLATEYRARRTQVRCTKDGSIEWFRPAARGIQAAVNPAVWRYSWQRSCGASACA
jgi:hypothetical protein